MAEESCISLPAGQIDETALTKEGETPSVGEASGDPMLETDCRKGNDECVTIFEQTSADSSSSLENRVSPCVDLCDDNNKCVAWVHIDAGTSDSNTYAKCCVLTSKSWNQNCDLEKDGYTSGPRQSERPVADIEENGETDGTALTIAGGPTKGNLMFASKDTSNEEVSALQVWSIDGVDRNVANIRIASGNSNLCVTTQPIEEGTEFSTVWLSLCSEDEENPDQSQLWIFTGFGDNEGGSERLSDISEEEENADQPFGLTEILREAGVEP